MESLQLSTCSTAKENLSPQRQISTATYDEVPGEGEGEGMEDGGGGGGRGGGGGG